MSYKHLFGPVPSRRLGISLGIDLLPFKTCSFNCIYCECGRTTDFSLTREEFFPLDEIWNELEDYFATHPAPDFLTFSGSGEPTLYSRLGELIQRTKKRMPGQHVAILTNSSLFHMKDVREDCSKADVVLPSLDSARIETFVKIDRPARKSDLNAIIDGLVEFRKIFPGEIWLEIFFALGINDSPEDVTALHEAISKIRPDIVQLNTLDRPPAEFNVKPVPKAFLESIVTGWNDCNVEIISRFKDRSEISGYSRDFEDELISTISRRPLTRFDIERAFGKSPAEINKYLDILEKEKKIKNTIIEGKIFIQTLS